MENLAPVIELESVSLSFDGSEQALREVTLQVERGEWVCILGANGSGKSTLAQVATGLLAPDEGNVKLVGETVCTNGTPDAQAYARARQNLGLVFQNPDDQIVTTVVEEDVAFGPENLGLSPEEIGLRVERELARVALTSRAKDNPTRLSGGQKQRVAIAGALALEPEVLVLDEPGALLDVRGREAIMRVAKRLNEAGTTIMHVTHFMDEALLASRVVVLDHGSIALEGTPQEVFAQADLVAELGLEMPRAARLAMRLGLEPLVDEDELVRVLAESGTVGQALCPTSGTVGQALCPTKIVGQTSQSPAPTPEALSPQGITYSYHDSNTAQHALLDVSFSVPKGSTCAIVGQTGSGKSTLLRILCGLEQPDSGKLFIDGTVVSSRRDWRKLRGRVGYVMQHPERQLFAETVAQDVAFGPTNLGFSKDEIETRVALALDAVGLTGHEDSSPFELSGGQQRLCAIAGVLAMNPEVLVLDEPTAGLDPRGRAELRAMIETLAQWGSTIVVVTHSMEDAARKDQVVVLNDGSVLSAGTPEEVFSPAHADALKHCGLGLPWPLAFALKLRDAGLDVGLPLTTEALVDAIAQQTTSPEKGGAHGA